MAIRTIENGRITCDACSTVIAKLRASRQVFEVFEDEAKFVTIRCAKCDESDPSFKERKD